MSLYLPMVMATSTGRGQFTMRASLCENPGENPPDSESFIDLVLMKNYVGYDILEAGSVIDNSDDVEEHDDEDGGDNGRQGSSENNGIDYTAREDVVIYAKDASGETVETTYINLTKETLTTSLSYTYFSVDGGTKWKKGPLNEKKFASLLNKGMTFMITDKFDAKAKKPEDDAAVYSFDTIAARPQAPKYKVNYLACADNTGATPGGWILMEASGIVLDSATLAALEIGAAGEDKKSVSEAGYGLWPENGGITLAEMPSTGKQATSVYYVRVKPSGTTPASKAVKVSVKGQAKAVTVKINYKNENIKLKEGMIVGFGENAPETLTEISADAASYEDYAGKVYIADTKEKASAGVNLSAYLTGSRNKLRVWKTATAKKPASAPFIIEPAARAAIAGETLSVTGGKLKLDKKYEVYDESKQKWGGLPKVSSSCELKVRLKATAKGGKESDSTYAASETAKLVITWGVTNAEKNKQGVTEVKIEIADEETDEPAADSADTQ